METRPNTVDCSPSITGADPRCPQCGRAVIGGTTVQGNEGLYHLECTQPPLLAQPVYPFDYYRYYQPYDFPTPLSPTAPLIPNPHFTCGVNSNTAELN